MAAFDYSRAQATASRLIARFGRQAVLRAAGAASGDPWDPTPGTLTDHPVTVAVLGYDDRDVDGTLIKATDKRVYLSTEGLPVAPETTHSLIIGAEEHTIVAVRPLSPSTIIVFYELQARA